MNAVHINKIKNEKVRTVPISNRKNLEARKINYLYNHY